MLQGHLTWQQKADNAYRPCLQGIVDLQKGNNKLGRHRALSHQWNCRSGLQHSCGTSVGPATHNLPSAC